MARVTVEDCLEYVENRFSLVHLTAQRARQLLQGSPPTYECRNRHVVTSLREIGAGLVLAKSPEEVSAEEETD